MKRGRKLSAAHKAAIAAAHTGKRRSPEQKLRMSLARREMLRKKHTPAQLGWINEWKWWCQACGTLTNDGQCDCTKFDTTAHCQRLVPANSLDERL
jgi:hypothetical protein